MKRLQRETFVFQKFQRLLNFVLSDWNCVNKSKWMHRKYLLYWVFKDTSALVRLLLVSINKVVFFSHVLLKALLKWWITILKFKSDVNRTMGGAHFYLKSSCCLDQPIGGSKVIIRTSSFCCLGLEKRTADCLTHLTWVHLTVLDLPDGDDKLS